jgi:putative transposase
MPRHHATEEQIAAALREADAGTPVVEICRKLGVHANTLYHWRKRYGSLGVPEVRELRQLREENRKLKQLVADLSLDRKILQDVISKKL